MDFTAPIAPLTSGPTDAVHRLIRFGTVVGELRFGVGSFVLDVALDGRLLYADRSGGLRIAETPTEAPDGGALADGPVVAAAFAPSEPAAVAVFAAPDASGSVERVDLEDGERTPLAPSGADPRWLP
jgi:hypothetical protein